MEGTGLVDQTSPARYTARRVREYGKTAKDLVKGQEQLLEKLQDMRFDLSKTEREITRVLNQVKTSQQCMASFMDTRGSRSARGSDEQYTSEYPYVTTPRYNSVCEDLQYRNLRHIARKYGSNNPSCVYQYNTEDTSFSNTHYGTKTSTPRSQSTAHFHGDEDVSPRYDHTPSMYGSTPEFSEEEEEEEFHGQLIPHKEDGDDVRHSHLSRQSSFTSGSDVSDTSSFVTVSTTSTLRDSGHDYIFTDV